MILYEAAAGRVFRQIAGVGIAGLDIVAPGRINMRFNVQ
jgi:hypothetical protein